MPVRRRWAAFALLVSFLLATAVAGACSNGGGSGGRSKNRGSGAGTGSGSTTPPSTTPPQPAFRAGVATGDLTPGPGVGLGGFGGDPRRVIDFLTVPPMIQLALTGTATDLDPSDPAVFFRPNQGVHDPIMVRVLVLDDGVEKYAIVKIDAIGASRRTWDAVAAVAAPLGIPQENLMLCATHTHSGPSGISESPLWQLIAMDAFHQPTFNAMIAKIGDAVSRAHAALEPAEVAVGSGMETNASHNRRDRPGVFDPEVGVVKIVRPDGTPICALFNFAVHGTSLDSDNFLYSADCMGYAERFVESLVGSGVTAIFTNGAEGDVAPDAGDWTGAESTGRTIAERVHQVWQSLATTTGQVALQAAFEDVAFPPPVLNVGCFELPGTTTTLCDLIPGVPIHITVPLLSGWLPSTLPFQAFRIDVGAEQLAHATVPGEAITEIGFEIKARARAKGFEHAYVIGLANDHMGYIATQAEYDRGKYEGQATLYGRDTGPLVVDSADRQLDKVKP